MKRILFIDNFDSFTYNLVDEFQKRDCQVLIYRNDIPPEELEVLTEKFKPGLIVLSPGPSTPGEAGSCIALIKRCCEKIPIFGVCLGHQCMIEAFGGKVGPANEIVHGKVSPVSHNGKGIYEGVPNPFLAGRYHSLAGLEIPAELEVTAQCGDIVMGIAHRRLPLTGVQYHPESILTAGGHLVLENLLKNVEVHHA